MNNQKKKIKIFFSTMSDIIFKISGPYSKSQKMKVIVGKKVFNKRCWKWSKLIFQIFLFCRKLKNERARAKKRWFLRNFRKCPKKTQFLALARSFLRFWHNKKIWSSNLDHFQQLLLNTFLPTMTFIFRLLL